MSVPYTGFPLSSAGSAPVSGKLYEDRNGRFWVATRVLSSFVPGGAVTTRFTPPHRGPADSRLPCSLPSMMTPVEFYGSENPLCVERVRSRNRYCTGSTREREPPPPTKCLRKSPGNGPAASTRSNRTRAGKLWLGTTYGLIRFDPATGAFVHYPNTHADIEARPERAFNALAWDQAGKLWVHVPGGLERFDPDTGEFDRFQPARFWYMPADPAGQLWLYGGWPGLRVFDPRDGSLKSPERYSGGASTSLAGNVVAALAPDRDGSVWAYFTQGGGMHRFSPARARFGKFLPNPGDANSLSGGNITGFAEDRDGLIWISTEHEGLNRFDPASSSFTHFRHIPGDKRSLASDSLSRLYQDRSGTLWIGNSAGIGKFDPKTGRYQHLRDRFQSHSITSLFEDRSGRFWAGDWLGPLHLVDRQTGEATLTKVVGGYSAHQDRNGNLWFGAFPESLTKLDINGNIRGISLARTADGSTVLGTSATSFHEDSAGILWIATNGAGLVRFDPATEASTRYTVQDGLPTNELLCLLPDELGNLWLGTSLGLSRFNVRENRFYNYDERDGLQGVGLPIGACYRARDGRLYFGGYSGFNAFYPKEVLADLPQPSVTLTDFQVSGKTPVVLTRPLWDTASLKLSPEQNGFTVGFTTLSYVSPWKTRYRFRLESQEKEWTTVDSEHRSARYTKVAPGDYVFRVQASSRRLLLGRTGRRNPAQLRRPRGGRHSGAASPRCLAFAGLLYGAYRARVKSLQESERRLQTVVAQRTDELVVARDQAQAADRAKTVFLANMSHELRTPLNAILGFSNLLRRDSVSPKQRQDLDAINRGGEHLLQIIDDVLDMAKIEAGRITMEVAPCDLGILVLDVMDMMRPRASQKDLGLVLASASDLPSYIRADAAHLRQVLINLLGNAVKYTEKGSVTLRVNAAQASEPPTPPSDFRSRGYRNRHRPGGSGPHLRCVRSGGKALGSEGDGVGPGDHTASWSN